MNDGENRNLVSQNLSNNNQLNTYNNQQPNVNYSNPQNNVNYNNMQYTNPQPNSNYDYSNNLPNNTNEPKNNNLIIIILLLLVIGLAGYIIYDKVTEKDANNNKENVNNNENNNQNDVNNNDVNNNQNNDQNNNETNNNDNSERIYSKDIPVSKTINGKTVNLEYKISIEYKEYDSNVEPYIIVDFFINGNKIETWENDLYPAGNDCFSQSKINSDINDYANELATTIGIINGDKEYIYVLLPYSWGSSKLLVLNENVEIITSESIIPNKTDAMLIPGPNCKKYESYNKKSYFIDNDAVYYLKPSSYDENWEHTYANEYKLTFANDKVIKEKINTCEAQIGGTTDYIFFEDMVGEEN